MSRSMIHRLWQAMQMAKMSFSFWFSPIFMALM
jgi:hypothetical protein